MDTVELRVCVPEAWQDVLIAELSALDFDAFQQDAAAVKAYIAADQWSEARQAHIATWLRARGLPTALDTTVIPAQNWNARWEATIQPLAIGPFLVKPTWAEVPPEHTDKLLLEIDPKMSFGTGYHESTRLALRFLPAFVSQGDTVLDAGTGTGILAIAAVRLGAAQAIAFDNDPWVEPNVAENLALNHVEAQVVFRQGTLDAVPEDGFDLILANINRAVLLDLLPAFARKLKPRGHVLLAGLLTADRAGLLAAAAEHGLGAVQEASEGEWWSVVLAPNK